MALKIPDRVSISILSNCVRYKASRQLWLRHFDEHWMRTLCSLDRQSKARWISNQRPVLRSHDQWGPIIGQGPDTTVKLPHDTQKGQPNAIPKISMLSLLSITAQLSFHASVTDHFHHLSKIISQFIPVDGVLARVNKEHTGHIWPPDTNWGSPDWKLSQLSGVFS